MGGIFTILGLFFGNWGQQILILVVCVTIIVMMIFGAGLEINVNSKNWVRQSVRVRTNTRVIDHNRRLRNEGSQR